MMLRRLEDMIARRQQQIATDAARRQALEQAARLCEEVAIRRGTPEQCAAAIRGLLYRDQHREPADGT